MNYKQLCFVIRLIKGKEKNAFTGELDHSDSSNVQGFWFYEESDIAEILNRQLKSLPLSSRRTGTI